jgi:hypothetical protein
MKQYVTGELHGNWKNGKRICKQHVCVYISSRNYVPEHKLIVEKAMGKSLPPEAVVHHINRNPHDNRNVNLVVCQNHSYHQLLHQRQRALEASGHADWLRCRYCKQYDDPKNLLTYTIKPIKSNERTNSVHSKCSAEYQRNRRLRIKNERRK